MKCVLCGYQMRGKPDLKRHADVAHKLIMAQYHVAAKAVQQAYGGLDAFRAAMKTASLVLFLSLMVGCRGVDRLLGQNDDHDTPAPAAPMSALGAWSGSGTLSGDVTVNGHTFTMDINVPTQAGANVSGTWVLLVPNSDDPMGPPPFPAANGTIEGTIDANGAFAYTLTESPSCVGHGTATVTSTSMSITFTGTGNPSCDLWYDGGAGTLTK